MIWFCGGHGVCLTLNEAQLAEQNDRLLDNTLDWLDRSLMGGDVDIPKFQFVDQNGQWYTADLIPTDDGFTNGDGGLLGIVPLLGGSGTGPRCRRPIHLAWAPRRGTRSASR
jgi:ABC-2 type transport system ATP-binding protein